MDQERFDNMIKVIDESYDLIQEYDSKPRQFGKVMLYPVETHTLAIIGNHPGIKKNIKCQQSNFKEARTKRINFKNQESS